MRQLRLSLLAFLLVSLSFGCNTQAKWTYPVEPQTLYRSTAQPADVTIAVLPFQEERPLRNRFATFLVYAVPLAPFGWITYERPEAAKYFNTIKDYDLQLDEDFGKAAARSLDTSRLVRHAYFSFGGDALTADYTLRGTVRQARYYGRIISYGLSAYGPALWFLGLPAGTSENTLEIVFSLEDKERVEVWNYRYVGSASITQGLYYNWGNDTLNFAFLMQEAMNGALQNLSAKLPELEDRAERKRRAMSSHEPTRNSVNPKFSSQPR